MLMSSPWPLHVSGLSHAVFVESPQGVPSSLDQGTQRPPRHKLSVHSLPSSVHGVSKGTGLDLQVPVSSHVSA